MSLLILMRHGQSMWNAAKLFTGWVDVPLTNVGIEEAIEGGKKIAHLDMDEVHVSTLIRAQMTAMLALAQHGGGKTPVFQYPAPEGGTSSVSENEARMIDWAQIRGDAGSADLLPVDVPPPSGESLKLTAERTIPYLNDALIPALKQGKNLFVAAHGNSLRSIIMHIEGLSEEQVLSLEVPTGQPMVYAWSESGWERHEL